MALAMCFFIGEGYGPLSEAAGLKKEMASRRGGH